MPNEDIYHNIVIEDGFVISACSSCGGFVLDEEQHTKWHESQRIDGYIHGKRPDHSSTWCGADCPISNLALNLKNITCPGCIAMIIQEV